MASFAGGRRMVEPDCPLNEIETLWSDVSQAHSGEPEAAHAAQARLMLRYIGAIRRYLLALTRDPEVADELTQEFALRALLGSFKGADPSRGRFRDLVRTAVRNLVHDYHRRTKTRPVTLSAEFPEPAGPRDDDEPDEPFLRSWRSGLYDRATGCLGGPPAADRPALSRGVSPAHRSPRTNFGPDRGPVVQATRSAGQRRLCPPGPAPGAREVRGPAA